MIRWLIFLLTISSTAFCQQLIEGRVLDNETGKPVPFASIGIVGTSKGTSSNLDGQFSLAISTPFTIRITCVGYQSLEVPSTEGVELIRLSPIATQLNEIFILSKSVNPGKIVRRAFGRIMENYHTTSFLQKFFYRHYCQDDEAYGRLIEAFVDVWKHQGYKSVRRSAGDGEEIRITQLRRSLDKTFAAQGHEPIAIGNILQADLIGYQSSTKSPYLKFYEEVSALRMNLENYSFSFDGVTIYDGQEVYKIDYMHKVDSVLTTSGYLEMPQANGSLYITTDNYAIIKTEDERKDGPNTIRTSGYYRKYEGKYYPYHFIREGENHLPDKSIHLFHIELISIEVQHNPESKFIGKIPGKEQLLAIPYDSIFWKNNTILKTTPLEDEIIRDLGGGKSLNAQFFHYRQYEWSLSEGGVEAEEKFNWFKEDSSGKRILYLIFWDNSCELACMRELDKAKQLQRQYRNSVAIVMLSFENDETKWRQLLAKYSSFAGGIIHYRIGENSPIAKTYGIEQTPTYVLLSRNGAVFDYHAKNPGDPLLEEDIKLLMAGEE
jgi:hypothetical protein